MPSVVRSVPVTASPEVCFDLSQSKPLRLAWDPFVREQRLLDGATEPADGVRHWTRSKHGLTMVAEYVSFQRPRVVAMRMVEGPWFFRLFAASWRFEALDEVRTEVTFRYRFACPDWAAPVAHPVGARVLGRDIDQRLSAFATAVEDPDLLARLRRASS